MKITREEVLHVAELARLHLDESSIDNFSDQIANILEYVDKLRQINTEGVSSTSHAVSRTNAFREDSLKEHLKRERTLSNAPDKSHDSFIVPKIIR